MFEIVKRKELNPTVTLIEVKAPLVAKKAEPGQFIILRTDENGERTYQIKYSIGPENATNKGVRYAISSKSATVDENGLVTFTKKGDAVVTIMPIDGSNCSDTLTISFKS